MKRLFGVLSIAISIVVVVFALAACAGGVSKYDASSPDYAVTPESLGIELERFVTENRDRTTYSATGERVAAQYLNKRLLEIGYIDVSLQEFTVTENKVSGLKSQNVVAHLLPSDLRTTSTQNVIIGAYYDNRYSAAYEGDTAYKSTGALSNGTGVATLIGIAEYLLNNREKLSPELDVTIVFFGASFLSERGAAEYSDKLGGVEFENTVLMIELQRLGCDYVYAFSDVRNTAREAFFDDIAAANGLDIRKPAQSGPIMIGASALRGVPYYSWAHTGVFPVFYNDGIPTLNLIGANWETYSLADCESASGASVSFTADDTLDKLTDLHPDYANKMAAAATLTVKSILDGEFVSVMRRDRDAAAMSEVPAMMWLWYLVVVWILFIAGVVTLTISRRIGKNNPIRPSTQHKVKMAVFGMDYENPADADIFIDVKPVHGEEIFPGVANNDDCADGAVKIEDLIDDNTDIGDDDF